MLIQFSQNLNASGGLRNCLLHIARAIRSIAHPDIPSMTPFNNFIEFSGTVESYRFVLTLLDALLEFGERNVMAVEKFEEAMQAGAHSQHTLLSAMHSSVDYFDISICACRNSR